MAPEKSPSLVKGSANGGAKEGRGGGEEEREEEEEEEEREGGGGGEDKTLVLIDPDSVHLKEQKKGCSWEVRHTFAALSLSGIALMYAMRVVLSIALVAMVGPRASLLQELSSNGSFLLKELSSNGSFLLQELSSNGSSLLQELSSNGSFLLKEEHSNGSFLLKEEAADFASSSSDVCPLPEGGGEEEEAVEAFEGEFDWDESLQGLVLGAFFWGYCCTNAFGGRASEHFGGRVVGGAGVVLSAFLALATPAAARASAHVLVAVRVAGGLAQGVVFPAVNSMLASWVPPLERSRYSTIVFSGFPLGTVVSLSVGGLLCRSSPSGWASAFYLFGALGLVWGLLWFRLVRDSPEGHPGISEAELLRLREAFGGSKKTTKEAVEIRWKEVLSSPPFWGLMVGALGYDFGFYALLTELPSYLKNVQRFDIGQNGLTSALPFLCMWLWGYAWGAFVDRLTAARKVSILTVRRLSMAAAMYGPMLFVGVVSFSGCASGLAVVSLCVSSGLSGSANCGFLCSHQDVAPNLAGTMLGLSNTLGALAGAAAPLIAGAITKGNQTLSAWRSVFLVIVAVYFVTSTVYVVLITDQPQPWNEPRTRRTEEEEEKEVEGCQSLVSDDSGSKLDPKLA